MSGEVKKKIRPGAIELHPEELALVVNYEVQEVLVDTQELQSSSAATKKISIKALNAGTDLQALASEIVDKCKLIHPSKVGHVQELLQTLLEREQPQTQQATQPPTKQTQQQAQPQSYQQQQQQQQQQRQRDQAPASQALASPKLNPEPSVTRLSSPASASGRPGSATAGATAATAGGGSPTRSGRARPGGAGAAAAAGGLAADDARERGVVQVAAILQQRHGPAFLEEIDDYIEGLYGESLEERAKGAAKLAQLFRDANCIEALLGRESLLGILARLLREDGRKSLELAAALSGCFYCLSAFSQLQRPLLDHQVGTVTLELIELEIKRTEHRAAEDGAGATPAGLAQRAAAAAAGGAPLTERERKQLGLLQRQDRFLYTAVALLRNMAEDAAVERKMKKKNLVVLLVKLLERSNIELLTLVASFLTKLSAYVDAKDRMGAAGAVQKLARMVPVKHEGLLGAVLRLLHNLSFDANLRKQMVKAGLIPKLVDLFGAGPALAPVALGLMYHLSMDDDAKSTFAFTDALPKIFDSLMRSADLRAVPELIALAVNLTHSARVAEWFCEGDRLERLLRRALGSGTAAPDDLALKLVRNLAAQGSDVPALKQRLLVQAQALLGVLQSPGISPELFVEALGTLAALDEPSFDWQALNREYDLLGFLCSCLAPGALDDDALLEAVQFVSVILCESTAQQVADAGLLPRLFEIMAEKRSDDEFVAAIASACERAMRYTPTRATLLLGSGQAVLYLVDLLGDRNPEVRRAADAALDAAMDSDENWALTIRNLKFESHNESWLGVVQTSGDDLGATLPRPGTGTGNSGANGGTRRFRAEGGGGAQADGDEDPDGYYQSHMVVDFEEYAAGAAADAAGWGGRESAVDQQGLDGDGMAESGGVNAWDNGADGDMGATMAIGEGGVDYGSGGMEYGYGGDEGGVDDYDAAAQQSQYFAAGGQ